MRFDEVNKNLEKVFRKVNIYGVINWFFIDLFILFGNVVIFLIVVVIINKNDNIDIKLLVGDIY